MKLAAPKPEAAPAPMAEPAAQTGEPKDTLDFGSEMPEETPKKQSNDLPFEKEPFDAGVEADEDTDPKKFIQQLSGKLGEALRKYTEEQGQPDFELEKFAVNSVISATHTGDMDKEDMNDIIKKVKNSGKDDSKNPDMGAQNDTDSGDDTNDGTNDSNGGDGGFGSEDDTEDLEEYTIYENEDFILEKGKRMSIFAPEGSDEFMEINRIVEERGPCWPGHKKVKGKKDYSKGSCEKIEENMEEGESNNYMFWQNLKGIYDDATEILEMNHQEVDNLIADGHQWALEHVITSKDDIEEVYHFIEANIEGTGINEGGDESNNYMFWSSLKTIQHASKELLKMDYDSVDKLLSDGHGWALDHIATANDDMEEVYHFLANTLDAYDGDTEGGYEDEYGSVENVNLNEAKYRGRTVKLGKPSSGDVKKFKVYVKNRKGNVVKVNFGDPNMEIKRDNPKRRKSFRARHKCSQAKDRTTPKYWSCKMWSKKPVSKIVSENLLEEEKNSNINKNLIKIMLQETFIPETKPVVKPEETKPTRKARPFTFEPDSVPKIDPKALNEGKFDYEIYHKTLASCFDEAERYVTTRGYDPIEFDLSDAQHVAYGQTQKYNKELKVDGELQRKMLHVIIYRMDSGTYELTMYFN